MLNICFIAPSDIRIRRFIFLLKSLSIVSKQFFNSFFASSNFFSFNKTSIFSSFDVLFFFALLLTILFCISNKAFLISTSPLVPINLTTHAFLSDSKFSLNSSSVEIVLTFSTILRSSEEISDMIFSSSGDFKIVLLAQNLENGHATERFVYSFFPIK